MNKPSQPFAWSHGDKRFLGTITVVLILVALVIVRTIRLNAPPHVVIPMPVMPSPNAFDYFNKAGASVVDETKISYAMSSVHTPSSSDPDDHPYSQAAKEALIQENAAALKTLRQGFAYPYLNPPARSYATLFPYYAKYREMARLLILESQVKAGRGDWGGAIDSNLDSVQIGVMVPHGSVLIGSLVGIACEAIGRRPIWLNYTHLDAAQSRAAAKRLEGLSSQAVSFGDTLQEEKWMGQAGLMQILRAPDWKTAAQGLSGGMGSNPLLAAELLLTPRNRIMSNYTHYMDQEIAVTRQPYGAHSPWPAIPNDPLSQILCFDASQGWLKATNNQTQDALLMTTLALHAYQLEHGSYPSTLTALAPAYLSKIPADPFAASGPLQYHLTGKTYVLYSIGPDGKDDGGTAIFDQTKHAPTEPNASDPRRYFSQDSKGDIVAGVNIY